MKKFDVVIIGAGPAGVFCAISLKQYNKNLKIAIVEKGKPLLKLLLSGGGRCNLSNINATFDKCLNFYPRGSRFISHLFHEYNFKNFCDWLTQNNIEIKYEDEGKIFLKCDDSSQLEKLFLQKLKEYEVEIIKANFFDFEKNNDFNVNISIEKKQIEINSKFLVIAAGSNKNLLELIAGKNIMVNEFKPSLYGFKSTEIAKANLAGISGKDVMGYIEFEEENDKKKKINKIAGDLLFTHEGLSGPLILKLSSYNAEKLFEKKFKCKIHIDFFHKVNQDDFEKNFLLICHKGGRLIKNIANDLGLPYNLWKFILDKSCILSDKKSTEIKKEEAKVIIKNCKDLVLNIDGKSQNKEEFVSAGGVELKEISNECESKKVKGLYFIGEILNIDGITGGFNLQACWTTAFICSKSIASSFSRNLI